MVESGILNVPKFTGLPHIFPKGRRLLWPNESLFFFLPPLSCTQYLKIRPEEVVFLGDLPQASRLSFVPHYFMLHQEAVNLWLCSQRTLCLLLQSLMELLTECVYTEWMRANMIVGRTTTVRRIHLKESAALLFPVLYNKPADNSINVGEGKSWRISLIQQSLIRLKFHSLRLVEKCEIICCWLTNSCGFMSSKAWTSQPWTDQRHQQPRTAYRTLPGQRLICLKLVLSIRRVRFLCVSIELIFVLKYMMTENCFHFICAQVVSYSTCSRRQ